MAKNYGKKNQQKRNLLKLAFAALVVVLSYNVVSNSNSIAQNVQVVAYILGFLGIIFGSVFFLYILNDVITNSNKDIKQDFLDDKNKRNEKNRQLQPSTHVAGVGNNKLKVESKSPRISL